MGRLRELLAHGGIAVLAVLFALSFATFNLAVAVSRELVSALQQRAFDEDGGGDLSFTIFGTNISYAEVLLYAIAFVIVAAGLLGTWLLTRRDMRTCPECRSHVPREATTCRFCTSELQSEPVDA
jgi:large conductance mechanosensitive channel